MRNRPKVVNWSKRMKDAGQKAALTRKWKMAGKKAAETRRKNQEAKEKENLKEEISAVEARKE
jgi:hypothetical protein